MAKKISPRKKVKKLTPRQKKLRVIEQQLGILVLTLAKINDALGPIGKEIEILEKQSRRVIRKSQKNKD